MNEREPIFDDLRTMFQVLDPPPAHLTDAMIAAIAAEDLDADYALLSLLSRSTELAGTRGSGILTIEFSHDETSVLLRVAELDDDQRRIDGWVTGTDGTEARLVAGERSTTVPLTDGRFEFASVPAGLIRIYFSGGDTELATPTFEI
ncbi:hypothetical protein [Aeromicrobium sp.]|uniref:hypothetical protein n=1 Tax=Aeromicrobium sp. TaxID=1871063 RepID=UPI0028A88B9D|nr:hypothetical protein [Aeromicrobium sp.]